ncbi:hypothetical protein SARC_11432 [Sphaeroforma arctica JP610]|uniref:Uncharacterized protein n=1 Tax=Sphaeroforma arctica JP610 TaxID=667725 RepID=A0A0L0FH11_9EUKA|nr:hypothetical protein SARC_11432 [Sphaeroforma arctica JP610]KNC76057.1 hypothetical protein SARC_11432 [Sphaeroforma arctica JP610]|eukprot:XP_014149959.1 hypothetical protein SARC_11432 [Sphaeroforma arctica JP610]
MRRTTTTPSCSEGETCTSCLATTNGSKPTPHLNISHSHTHYRAGVLCCCHPASPSAPTTVSTGCLDTGPVGIYAHSIAWAYNGLYGCTRTPRYAQMAQDVSSNLRVDILSSYTCKGGIRHEWQRSSVTTRDIG